MELNKENREYGIFKKTLRRYFLIGKVKIPLDYSTILHEDWERNGYSQEEIGKSR